ncbi:MULTISPECIES: 2-hydroxyacyl-CoA dehydratase [Halomonadaceae]|uniref:2-hydroxyacyl-CoA dehydratase n=1 Tax=Billgrantia aerodenitrificans TaxID=2733483 RepID=A0ABS9AW23_9GAMM|nr:MULTISPECIES: 2-hydroxyacyl-CoA dehydratase [Halomonas]MCE8025919.1 2-hydroxyacyl-CoA dehydratase [Halomonas aerodenitrificans]MCE8037262.1 2-hydroxyacyl-CoA dehydratase [Halomonas sp. MCCC 1A11062]
MRFHQVKELVDWAADYHARLADQYARLAASGDDERVKMALEYLAQRERKLQGDLLGYLDDGSDHRSVLEAWFDDPNDFPHAPVLERLPDGVDGKSVQDVLATALTAHRTLQDLYAHRAELAGGSGEKGFFEALASGHEAEVRRIARDMQRLEDY